MHDAHIHKTALTLALRRGLVAEDPTTAALAPELALHTLVETGLLDTESLARLRAEAEAVSAGDVRDAETPLGLFPVKDLSRYRPELYLGDGGMGRVFLAQDVLLKRRVALKFFRTSLPRDAQIFQREAQSQARIDHPNVAKVFEAGEIEGIPFLSMQYIQGPTLAAALEDLSLTERVDLVRQAALGVHAGHRLGIIHRDVKPGNIMLERNAEGRWQAYVMDFGLARDLSDPQLLPSTTVMGTPAFMAPEQVQGPAVLVGPHTDVYALGVTLYQMATGKLPFPGASHAEVFRKIVEQDPPPLRSHDPDLPRDLESIVLRCMEKDVFRRYDSALDLAEDLARFLDGAPVRARPVGVWRRWARWMARNPWAVAAGGAVALLGGGWGVSALRSRARMDTLGQEVALQRLALTQATEELQRLRLARATEGERIRTLEQAVARAETPTERAAAEAQLRQSRQREVELAAQEARVAKRLPDPAPALPKVERSAEEPKRLEPGPPAPVHPGGAPPARVEAEAPVATPPALLRQATVIYPNRARQSPQNPYLGRTVEVLVQVQVDVRGAATEVKVLQGVPGGLGYDEAAVAAMKASTFTPATRDGQPVAGVLPVKVTFLKVR